MPGFCYPALNKPSVVSPRASTGWNVALTTRATTALRLLLQAHLQPRLLLRWPRPLRSRRRFPRLQLHRRPNPQQWSRSLLLRYLLFLNRRREVLRGMPSQRRGCPPTIGPWRNVRPRPARPRLLQPRLLPARHEPSIQSPSKRPQPPHRRPSHPRLHRHKQHPRPRHLSLHRHRQRRRYSHPGPHPRHLRQRRSLLLLQFRLPEAQGTLRPFAAPGRMCFKH